MITLSLCMIVRDEEDVLGRCLDSVKDAVDEIIIIDTGSEDRTKETALKYTQNVYDFPWRDGFSAARNFALEHGTMDYLMWMDADDVLPAESRRKLIRLKETLGADVDMVMMPYAAAFEPSGKTAFSYYRERIVKNRRGFRFFGRVHEVIPPSGRICYESVCQYCFSNKWRRLEKCLTAGLFTIMEENCIFTENTERGEKSWSSFWNGRTGGWKTRLMRRGSSRDVCTESEMTWER